MLEKIVIKLDNEEILNLSILKKDRLLMLVDESYSYPETLLSDLVKGIRNLLIYFYWDNFTNLCFWERLLLTHSDFVTRELDIILNFDYKGKKLEYFINIVESKFLMESVSINGKPAYFIENSFGNQYKCESFEEYQKISKLSNINYPTYYGSTLRLIDELFNKLINDIVTSEKSINEYNDRVKCIYKNLIPKLDLGITRVDIGNYGVTYYVGSGKNSEVRMSLSSLGSGMNTLAKSLPQAIDAIVSDKIYILDSDGLNSVHPILSKALIELFNKFRRGKLIMPSWSIPLDSLDFYNLKESNILKLHAKTPETLILE